MTAPQPDMLTYETGLRDAGYGCIVGIDEVGRGALAGPIVAAAVVLPDDASAADPLWGRVADSKTLTAARRTELAAGILERAAHVTIALLDAPVIDEIGIGPANRHVMEQALHDIERSCSPDFVLIDAMTIDSSLPQIGIIDGDAQSMSVAAASIVAKVHRDALMRALALEWPRYHWDRNKGYAAAVHLAALRAAGPCEHHRFSYRPVYETAFVRA